MLVPFSVEEEESQLVDLMKKLIFVACHLPQNPEAVLVRCWCLVSAGNFDQAESLGIYIPPTRLVLTDPHRRDVRESSHNGLAVVGSCLSYTARVGSRSLRVRSPVRQPVSGGACARWITPPLPNGALPVPETKSVVHPILEMSS